MGLGFLLQQPFAQHALVAAALVAVSCGLIGPFVVTRGMAFAVHGTAELAFTGAAAGLLVANNPVVGALIGSVKASVFITSVSFAIYVAARLAWPLLRDRRRSRHLGHPPRREATPPRPTAELPGTPVAAASAEDGGGSGDPATSPTQSTSN